MRAPFFRTYDNSARHRTVPISIRRAALPKPRLQLPMLPSNGIATFALCWFLVFVLWCSQTPYREKKDKRAFSGYLMLLFLLVGFLGKKISHKVYGLGFWCIKVQGLEVPKCALNWMCLGTGRTSPSILIRKTQASPKTLRCCESDPRPQNSEFPTPKAPTPHPYSHNLTTTIQSHQSNTPLKRYITTLT